MNEVDSRAAPGELFTRVYSERSGAVLDSRALRLRLGAYMNHDLYKDHWDLSVYLKKETGRAPDTWSVQNFLHHKYEDFVAGLSTNEFLDLITLVWRFLNAKYKEYTTTPSGTWVLVSEPANNWKWFVERVLLEENVGYVLDDRAGVRYKVDQQFDLQREAVLGCLSEVKYAAALAAFEDAHRYFLSTPQDLKAALRSLFESAEIVAKQQFSSDRLTSRLVLGPIKSRILTGYPDDPTACRAVGRVIDGFADWVDGMHYYRHGQGSDAPVLPPPSFVIYALSSGAAFIRWLVQIESENDEERRG